MEGDAEENDTRLQSGLHKKIFARMLETEEENEK
jgi:hypothetical protein